MDQMELSHLLAVSRGDEPADLAVPVTIIDYDATRFIEKTITSMLTMLRENSELSR